MLVNTGKIFQIVTFIDLVPAQNTLSPVLYHHLLLLGFSTSLSSVSSDILARSEFLMYMIISYLIRGTALLPIKHAIPVC